MLTERKRKKNFPSQEVNKNIISQKDIEALPKSRQKLIIPFQKGNQYQKRTTKGMEKEKVGNE